MPPIRQCLTLVLIISTFEVISATNIHRFTLKRPNLQEICSHETSETLEICHSLRKRNISPKKSRPLLHSLLINHTDTPLYGEAFLGTPPQKLKFNFDSSMSNVFVISKSCNVFLAPDSHKPYDGKKSSTYTGNGLCAETSAARVSYSSDTLKIGDLTVKRQNFVEIKTVRANFFASLGIDGNIGLGFTKPNAALTLLDNMHKQKLIKERIFSFVFNRGGGVGYGQLIFGGTDETLYKKETANYIPLSALGVWQIGVDKITLPEKGVWCENRCPANIIVGQPLIFGPKRDIIHLHYRLGIKVDNLTPTHVPCSLIDTVPPITFTINGRNYTLYGKDYILKIKTPFGNPCIFGFTWRYQFDQEWRLGNIFLEKFYSIFDADKKRVGLAELK